MRSFFRVQSQYISYSLHKTFGRFIIIFNLRGTEGWSAIRIMSVEAY